MWFETPRTDPHWGPGVPAPVLSLVKLLFFLQDAPKCYLLFVAVPSPLGLSDSASCLPEATCPSQSQGLCVTSFVCPRPQQRSCGRCPRGLRGVNAVGSHPPFHPSRS